MKGILIFLSGIAAVFCLFFLFFLFFDGHDNKGLQAQIDQAYQFYKKGETSETLIQRKDNFNAALKIYVQLENEYHPYAGTGKLYYNVGNAYFQLGEYPLAILYHYRALTLMPRNNEIKRNLAIAQEKLHLTPVDGNPTFHTLFFFYYDFSPPEKFQLFFFLGLVLIFLLFAYVWYSKRWLRRGSIFVAFFCLILLFNLIYTRYFEPLEGVLVRATSLYRDAGRQYAKASNQPLSGGLKVQVLDVREDGQWLKVITPEGTLGYVPIESIRIL
jgi:tetratricopeptide (TPR) repeat protein